MNDKITFGKKKPIRANMSFDQSEENLDKWKYYKNKSLIQILNNNQKLPVNDNMVSA